MLTIAALVVVGLLAAAALLWALPNPRPKPPPTIPLSSDITNGRKPHRTRFRRPL